MRILFAIGLSVFLVGAAALLGRAGRDTSPDEAARAAAVKLFQSLDAEQKKLTLKEFGDKERLVEQFPAVQRPGLPIAKLTAEQKAMVVDVVKAMTSAYGAERCLEIAKETPENLRFVNFFGEPGSDKAFAWRVASHHLTLLYAEFGKEKGDQFGPILLGGNPAKKLWDEEEQTAIAFFAALSPDEAKQVQAKGAGSGSGSPIGKAGVRIGDLGEKPGALARKLLQKRLDVLSADRQKKMAAVIERDGGVANLRIAVWGEITKSHLDGGNYHWRIGSDTVVCDWQTVGKNHIHMTLRGRSKA
jgi:Protein of unknown function (DUF3500)